jgi:hypothetical protein
MIPVTNSMLQYPSWEAEIKFFLHHRRYITMLTEASTWTVVTVNPIHFFELFPHVLSHLLRLTVYLPSGISYAFYLSNGYYISTYFNPQITFWVQIMMLLSMQLSLASYPRVTEGTLLRGKADHSPPASAKVKNTWIYTSTTPCIRVEHSINYAWGQLYPTCPSS